MVNVEVKWFEIILFQQWEFLYTDETFIYVIPDIMIEHLTDLCQIMISWNMHDVREGHGKFICL